MHNQIFQNFMTRRLLMNKNNLTHWLQLVSVDDTISGQPTETIILGLKCVGIGT